MTAPVSFTLRRLPHVVAVLLGMVLVLGVFAPAPVVHAGGGHRAKMSPEFAAKLATQSSRKQSAELMQVVLTAPQSVMDRLGRQYGLRLTKRMIAGGVFEGTADQISSLANDPQVGSLEENRRIFSMAAVTAQAVGADQVWKGSNGSSFRGTTGLGVGIAVLDSGIGHHPDLRNRVRARLDFTGAGGVRRGGDDDYGHGTHVAGIIAGSGQGSQAPPGWSRSNNKKSAGAAYIGMAPR